jgi:hypothetical protein
MASSGAKSLTQHACGKSGFANELVMPGLVPGIHVLVADKQERRGWPGRSPAMTEKRVASKPLEKA